MTRIELLYGDGTLPVDLPADNVTVIEALKISPLSDAAGACRQAFRHPINSRPLFDILHGARTVAIVIPDGTRPLPFERLLTWLFAEMDAHPCKPVIVVGTGSHRANTPAELER